MKTRRCPIGQSRPRPILAPGTIITCRDTCRAVGTLNEFKNRFGCSNSQAGIFKLFKNLDFDNDGYITSEDLRRLAESRGMPVSELDCHATMTKLDPKKAGSVNISEFMRFMSTSECSLLNQMQRTIVGLTRKGGTVYTNHYEQSSRSSVSTCDSGGRTLRGICEALKSGVDKYRASTGRLDNFYRGLSVPHRNLPWAEDNRYTVEPITTYLNPQCVSNRFSRGPISHHPKRRAMSYDHRTQISIQSQERNDTYFSNDAHRIAHKSAAIKDYYCRVNRPMCHV